MKCYFKYFILLISIFTTVNAKLIEIKPDSVFLGSFESGSDAVFKTIELKNLINSNVIIKGSEFIQNDEKLFSTEQRLPINIDVNSSAKIEFKFTPSSAKAGLKKAKYLLIIREPEEERDTIILTAEIKESVVKGFTSISIPNITAKVGEKFDLKILLNQFERKSDINNFVCILSFNATAMTPQLPSQRGKIEYNQHTITLSGRITNDIKSGDVLISIPMIAGLGDMQYSEITIKEFKWFFNDKFIEHEIKTQNGILELTGLYYENGIPRLISEKPNNLNLEILENPAKDYVKLSLFYSGEVKLYAYNLLGSFFKDFSSFVPYHTNLGYENITLNRQYFGSKGLYFIKLISQNSSASKLLFVE
ncbi:MAG: hypothetical protein N2319_06605 [Candidatus Kapabacteria bacterium]|nr:hypothetical protein [Candidatus Kapabacteria bacterium]